MDKKDIVLKNSRGNFVWVVIIAVLVFIIGVLVIPDLIKEKEDDISGPVGRYERVKGKKGEVKFPINDFGDEARYFTFNSEGKDINFFILKSNDGTIRAAFDACDVCFGARLGYDQVGDNMRCNNCGLIFPEDKINIVLGGCNPSPLDRSVVGDNLVIKVEDIIKGARFF